LIESEEAKLAFGSWCSSVSILTMLQAAQQDDQGLIPSTGKEFLLLCQCPSSNLSIVNRVIFPGFDWGMKLTTHLHLVSKLKRCGTASPLPHKPSQYGAQLITGHFHVCLICLIDYQ
jgi:hypothetical protein